MTEFGHSPRAAVAGLPQGDALFRASSSAFKSCTSVSPVAFICARTYSCSMVRPERCVVLAGAIPVLVRAGAPGGGLRPGVEARPRRVERRNLSKESGTEQRAATISERNSPAKLSAERCSK